MSTAAIIAGTVGSVAAGAIGSHAAGSAAKKQSDSAVQAAQIQADQSNKALDFQKSVYGDTQRNQAPFLKAGQGAVTQLSDLLAPGGALTQQWNQQFQAPTAEQAAQTPGYQFTFNQGLQALDRGAAARGNLLTGGMMQREQQYGQGLASQTYQQTFNNALTQYQQAYNTFQNNQANQYNRLAGLAGTGQTSAAQLGSAGQAAAGNTANIYENLGNSQASGINNAAAATASGYVQGANSWSNAIGGIGGQLGSLAGLYGSRGSSAPYLSGNLQPTDINQVPTIGTDYGWHP